MAVIIILGRILICSSSFSNSAQHFVNKYVNGEDAAQMLTYVSFFPYSTK